MVVEGRHCRSLPNPLNKMLGSEVRPEIHNLPPPKSNEEESSAHAKPFNTVVGAFVGITELLLTSAQVVHLANNLANHFLDTAQIGLEWLKLLGGLDGGPVLGIGANVDVELDVTAGVLDILGTSKVVLEAHVKGRVVMRGEDNALLASDILRLAVLVSVAIGDVHVDVHAIALVSIKRSRYNHQCVPVDKVSYASSLVAVV